jgi:2-iminobutanoate/2-iminopropanoate deaminase
MSHHRETVTAMGAPEPAGAYSHAVKSNGLVFVSGQVPIDPATGQLIEGSPAEQATRCLENLAVIAAAAGAGLADAVRMTVYVTDMSASKTINDAYADFFPERPPARVTIGVAALPLGADVEIDAVLALPD